MKHLRAGLMIISALTAGWAACASAGGVMYSAPSSDGSFLCDLRNAGTTPIEFTIETVSYAGTTSYGPFDLALDPGEGTFIAAPTGASCKVTLTKGSPRKVRGVAIYRFGTDGAYTIPIQ